jgi:hypothetical protein
MWNGRFGLAALDWRAWECCGKAGEGREAKLRERMWCVSEGPVRDRMRRIGVLRNGRQRMGP